jgi:hypothetical protein
MLIGIMLSAVMLWAVLLNVIMLSAVMLWVEILSVIMLSAVMLWVVMLSAIMPSVIFLSVVAQHEGRSSEFSLKTTYDIRKTVSQHD